MAVKAVVFDISDTLITRKGRVAAGILELLKELKRLHLPYALITNQEGLVEVANQAGIRPKLVVTKGDVGKPKPSPLLLQRVCDGLKLQSNEIVYVGDRDDDAFCASNAKVLYFHASWAGTESQYGLPVRTPAELGTLLSTFLTKNVRWFWTLQTKDAASADVDIRSVIDGDGAGDAEIKRAIINVLKERKDQQIGSLRSMKEFILMYFLSSLYLDGLYLDVDWWTTYPGHKAGSGNPGFDDFFELSAKLFRDRYQRNLLVRHATAPDSAQARTKGQALTFDVQVNTMHVNAEHRQGLPGKRVLVVDDFCTGGSSFECARNLLLRAGAKKVYCVSIGKYGNNYTIQTPRKDLKWDPFKKSSLKLTDFSSDSRGGKQDESALKNFLETLAPFRTA